MACSKNGATWCLFSPVPFDQQISGLTHPCEAHERPENKTCTLQEWVSRRGCRDKGGFDTAACGQMVPAGDKPPLKSSLPDWGLHSAATASSSGAGLTASVSVWGGRAAPGRNVERGEGRCRLSSLLMLPRWRAEANCCFGHLWSCVAGKYLELGGLLLGQDVSGSCLVGLWPTVSAGVGGCAQRSKEKMQKAVFLWEKDLTFPSIQWSDLSVGIALVRGDSEHQEGFLPVPHLTSRPHESRLFSCPENIRYGFPRRHMLAEAETILWSRGSAER